ncbi:MAG: hypothetical protein IKH88_04105 [Prevotella sp.]|nr:hypothetical protein [Prevotella sp.]
MNTRTHFQTKKPYAKPILVVERFVANDFCAICETNGYNMYKVASENVAISPDGSNMSGNVYYETNNITGLQIGGDNPDQYAGGGMSSNPGTAVDGYVYFDMNDAHLGYVINGNDPDVNQWWRVIIFHPLTYGTWDGKWHAYNQSTFVPTDSQYVINANNAS